MRQCMPLVMFRKDLNMAVIVNMACGLANRMFQYSYYLYLKKLGYDAFVDFYQTANLEHERVLWKAVFPNALIRQASAWEVFKTGGGSNVLDKVRRRYFPFSCNVKTLSAFEVPLPDRTERSVYIMGVFQNADMAEAVRDDVLNAFTFRPFTDNRNLALMKEVQATQSVAIHVRKGEDYRSRIYYQGTCPVDYYQKAVKLINEKVKNPRFYVFADNKEWVKENFNDFDYTLVEGNPIAGYGSHYDMQLMSLCRHNILSNSTYSWWGAFLNRNPDKTVVLPDIWFNPESCQEYTSKPVRCEGWIAL